MKNQYGKSNAKSIYQKPVPPVLEKYVNRINIIQIISFGKVTNYTMQTHLHRVCWFYKHAVGGLTSQDVSCLFKSMLDFYITLGIYTPYNGFVVNNLDKIPNSEWCTLDNFLTLLTKGTFEKDFDKSFNSFRDIVKATEIIQLQYYSQHSHTTIDIYELSHELNQDLFY